MSASVRRCALLLTVRDGSPALFLCVGVLTSQLFGTGGARRALYAAGIPRVGYALRMVADSGTGLEWLRWATPLGW